MGELAFCLLMVSCSATSTVSEDYKQWREGVYQDFISQPAPGGATLDDGSSSIDTLGGALRIAALRDLQLARLREAVSIGANDVEGAGALGWPRLGLEANIDYPLRGGNDGATGNGGLFLRYSLNEAIFQKDAKSAAELRLHLALQRYRERLAQLFWELREKAADYACAGRTRRNSTEALAAARQANDAARRLQDAGRADSRMAGSWNQRVVELSAKVEEADLNFQLQRKRLQSYLGAHEFVGFTEQVLDDVVGWGEALADLSDTSLLQQAWESGPRLRTADLSAQLAEYEVLKARRARLPKLSFRLGYGDIDVDNEQDASLVASMGINLPLVDLGDNRRLVENAKAARARARQELQAVARSLAADLAEGRMKVKVGVTRLRNAERSHQQARERWELLRELRQRRRVDSFELIDAQIDAYMKDSDVCQQQIVLLKSVAEFSLLRGEVPVEVAALSNGGPLR